ncbi:MAG TPA: hypothetical protein PK402_07390 [Tepidisphaeraceae bacterium]|nr:hypothetical protein [Tepidisphaeraceae bacterium]
MRRVLILGTSCSGKTTLARAIAKKYSLEHIELDELHWGPNWTPNADFIERVERAVAKDSWVIDGGYSRVRPLLLARADTVIWLNYPMRIVMNRALKRTLKRAWTREPMWAGNRESFRLSFMSKDSILLWVLTTWRKNRMRFGKLFRELEGGLIELIRFDHPDEAEAWLNRAT